MADTAGVKTSDAGSAGRPRNGLAAIISLQADAGGAVTKRACGCDIPGMTGNAMVVHNRCGTFNRG